MFGNWFLNNKLDIDMYNLNPELYNFHHLNKDYYNMDYK